MRIKLFCALFFLFSSFCSAQTMNDELNQLREVLGVASNVPIKLSALSRLPDNTPLNIYLAMGLDIYTRDRFLKWIEDWNKNDAKKLGALNPVNDIDELILFCLVILTRIE